MEAVSGLRQEIRQLMETRWSVEQELLSSRVHQQGSLYQKWVTCGRPECRCRAGERHGPFWSLSQRVDGKTRQRYVRAEELEQVSARVEAHRRWIRLRRRASRLTGEIERLLNQLGGCLCTLEGGARA